MRPEIQGNNRCSTQACSWGTHPFSWSQHSLPIPLFPGGTCLYSAMTLTVFSHWCAQMQIHQKTKAPAVLGRVLEDPVLDPGKAGGCEVERMSLRKGRGRKGRRRWIRPGRWMGTWDGESSPVGTYFPKCNANVNILCSHTRAQQIIILF